MQATNGSSRWTASSTARWRPKPAVCPNHKHPLIGWLRFSCQLICGQLETKRRLIPSNSDHSARLPRRFEAVHKADDKAACDNSFSHRSCASHLTCGNARRQSRQQRRCVNTIIWPPFPRWDGGFFFAVLLPFTCDFTIYSPCFKTARHGAAFGGMGVKVYPK